MMSYYSFNTDTERRFIYMKCEKCGAEIPAGMTECPQCAGLSADGANAEEVKKAEGSAAENLAVDADFEQRYSSMFEGKESEEKEYKVDEELKRKREARYDENFSNMTNEEKLRALEAARLARKEKREKKQNKKLGRGSEARMSASADKEHENSTVKGFGGNTEQKPVRRSDKENNKSDKFREAFAKKDRPENKRKKHEISDKGSRKGFMNAKLGVIAGCVIVVIVIGIIIASVNMASKAVREAAETPTIYAKGNVLYSSYDGKKTELSQSFIAKAYEEAAVPTATPKRGSDDEDEEDEENSAQAARPEQIKEKELINYAEATDVKTHASTGDVMTYFIDNADMNLSSGSLKYIKNGKKSTLSAVDDNVYYKIKVSSDGNGVLYLVNADAFGMGGTLKYWSAATGKSVNVGENVNMDNFMFDTYGKGIVYVSNYNSEYYVGDLYLVSIADGGVTEPKKLESDVYKAFGTNPAGDTVVYAKNYNDENLCFDLYMMKNEPVMITDGSRCEPIISDTADGMYAGGSYQDYYQSLYYVSLADGNKEKIASGLTELIEMSKDGSAVVFRKANAEGTAFDYFYARQDGTEAQELAMNITVLDDADHKRVCQFDINDDFTKAVYIQGYDLAAESGALYTAAINNGAVASDKKISDTAYSCNLTPDGKTVRFADNYDVRWNLVTLNSYTDEKNTVLAQEVGAGAFTFDKAGEYIVYAKNYSLESKTGDVYCVSNKGKTVEVAKGVSTYGLKGNGEIVYSASGDKGNSLYLAAPSGKKSKTVEKDITKVISY